MRYLDKIAAETLAGLRATDPLTKKTRETKKVPEQVEDSAVEWRVAAMHERHPHPWYAIPFLTVRDVAVQVGQCHSCGEPVAPMHEGMVARCWPCVLAARLLIAGG